MFNPVKLLKIARNKEFLQGLSDYHEALLLHLAYLKVKPEPDDFDSVFLAAAVKYIEALKEIGAPLEIPNVEPETVPE